MSLLRLVVEIVSISTDVTLSIIYVICHLGLTVVNFNAFNDISALLGVFPKKKVKDELMQLPRWSSSKPEKGYE